MLDTVIHNRDGRRRDEDDVSDADVETCGRRGRGVGRPALNWVVRGRASASSARAQLAAGQKMHLQFLLREMERGQNELFKLFRHFFFLLQLLPKTQDAVAAARRQWLTG